MSIHHVYPNNDTYPHDLESAGQCDCEPRVEFQGGDTMVIHNAWDGREIFEQLDAGTGGAGA